MEEQAPDRFDKTAEDIMENEELGLAILDCMGKLTEKQAKIFRMKTIEGLDTEAICNEFDITPSNLWVIIHRARTTLAQCLEKTGFKMTKRKSLFIDCSEAAFSCDKAQYKEASLIEKMKIHLHILFCKPCKKYTKQNIKLTNLMVQSNLKTCSEDEKSLERTN